MSTDDELIAEILKGSHAAAEVLIKRYYRSVFAFLYRKTGDSTTAYDLTQEVFIKVMKSIKSYRHENKFEHWLIKIALNQVNDFYKSREFNEKTLTVSFEEESDTTNVTNIIENSLRQQQIKDALLSLPKNQQDAVILFYYNGYKIGEIATLTNTKEATVKSRLHQALGKLRKLFAEGESYAALR